MTRRSVSSSAAPRSEFHRVDRRIAAAFLVVTAALLVAVFIVGSALYVSAVRAERERLSGVVASVLGPALEGLKASGEYKIQRLAERLQRDTPNLAYIRVLDAEGQSLAHSGVTPPGNDAADASVLAELSGDLEHRQRVRALSVDGRPLTEVAMALHAGYRAKWTGVLRLGIWGESASALLPEAGVIVGGLVIFLLIAAFPLVLWISRRLGAPMQTLALDFEGVMHYAPLHIAIEDETGHIAQTSAAFRLDHDLDPEARPRSADVLPVELLGAPLGSRRELQLALGDDVRTFLTMRFPVALAADGSVVRTGVIGADVPECRRDHAQRDQMAAAVESTGDLVLFSDAERGVVYANPAFLQHTGRGLGEVVGMAPLSLWLGSGLEVSVDSGPDLQTMEQAILVEGAWRGRVTAVRADDSTFPCELVVFPIHGPDGLPQAQVWSGRDVSRDVELEAQLIQSQRMEAVGRLAGGVAHDFNNLLTVINGMAELLLTEPLDEPNHASVTMIAEAGRRAAVLTRQLLAFGRRQRLDIREVDLNAIISGALGLMKSALGGRIQLAFEPGAALWTTRGDMGQIEQALMNLAINARDAMPTTGTVRVATENARLVGVTEADGAVVPDGDYVVLTVSDTGCGMPPSVVEHIFEPFFTTKDVGKGTGLGLAMVHGLVRQSGGHIWVYSQLDVGTTFRIAFPRSGDAASEAVPATTPERPAATARAGERVLVVDDDDAVRRVIAETLRQSGYRVVVAAGGEDALVRLADPSAPVDVLVTDLVMPGLDGAELARVVRKRYPHVAIVVMSGYAAQASELTGTLEGTRFLQKPPSTKALLEIVRDALDHGASATRPGTAPTLRAPAGSVAHG